MKYIILPDSILEQWGEDIRDSVIERGCYCLVNKNKVHELVIGLLDQTLESVRYSTDPTYLDADKRNGKDRRDKDGCHIKIILESLGRDPYEYDEEFKSLGLDMNQMNLFYQERRDSGSFYKTGIVIES